MSKATVQKYPCDETDLHSAIKTLVEYFDEIAETARRTIDRDSPTARPPLNRERRMGEQTRRA
jgi:hypothetical protein